MTTLPYKPCSILAPSPNATNLYILQPPTAHSPTSRLLSLDITRTLNSVSLEYKTISDSLPFITNEQVESYTPAIGPDGAILAYSGACSQDSQGSALWKFTPGDGPSASGGQWKQMQITVDSEFMDSTSLGSRFLASGVMFAPTRNVSATFYAFGGMCPDTDSGSASDWVQAASYSNAMLQITPNDLASLSNPAYVLSIAAVRGSPIPEAGFSITPLTPSWSQMLDADNVDSRDQNQNFVLVGGHTQQAFINMSQVALFSLPERSWTFIPIHDPTPQPKTDLATRASPTVEPRSGHTAILAADGRSIIIFGGWVGDTTTFANPQLAILQLGSGYGGGGDWTWTVPDQTGSGPDSSSGLFGHGAVMLPGNVMMILGGYQIPGSSSSQPKRSTAPEINSKTYFYNVSSNTWTDSYSLPRMGSENGHTGFAENDHMKASQKVGLGAGLALAILAILALTTFAFWYTRKLQRRRDAHEAELRNLADGVRGAHVVGGQRPAVQERSAGLAVVDWVGGPSGRQDTRYGRLQGESSDVNNAPRSDETTQAARTGMLFEIPSPTRGLRRSLHTRGSYQPAPRYDESRGLKGSGGIHPIDEGDEDEDPDRTTSHVPSANERRQDPDLLATAPKLDPFRDPERSRSASPQGPSSHHDQVGQWIQDWATAEAIARQQAAQRASPDKADRTSSTLSDQSAHSAVSAMSWPYSVGSVGRSISQRSVRVFHAGNAGNAGQSGPSRIDVPRAQSISRGPSYHGRAPLRPAPPHRERSQTSETYTTANATPANLPPDSQGLLSSEQGQSSPTRPSRRARGWMGSVRRAFVGGDRSASASPEHGAPSHDSSPTKSHHDVEGASRRLSTGPNPYRVQRGPGDWHADRPRTRTTGDPSPEDDWDIESAVENRVVQVMYTVPRDRLRVVNPGPDGDGISIPSRDGSVNDAPHGSSAPADVRPGA